MHKSSRIVGKDEKGFVRSTQVTLKYANANKRKAVSDFIDNYNILCQYFVDILWDMEKIHSLNLGKEMVEKAKVFLESKGIRLSARIIQCAGKQASGIVRGTKTKQKKRQHVYEMLLKEGKTKQAKKLKARIEATTVSKPENISVNPELDSRFVSIELNKKNSFDGWLTLSNLGTQKRGFKIKLPFNKTKHFNKMLASNGKITNGVRISKNTATFMFNFKKDEVVKARKNGTTLGLDMGIKNVFTTSDGQSSLDNKHGWNLEKIGHRVARRKKGNHC